MDKRYQVFVSSTYEDLQEERRQVLQALLELDCIPSGMELFPAADEDQWTLIKQVIDDCDYYVLIVGGRYGSIGPDGSSYTQMEYEYAVGKNKPVIAFLHRDPGQLKADRCEKSPEGQKKLAHFRELVQKKTCKYWTSPEELGSVVSRSIVKLIKNKPATGWVKADLVPDESASQEMLRLKKRIEQLEAELTKNRVEAPAGTDQLANGEDTVELSFRVTTRATESGLSNREVKLTTTWNRVFSIISPLMIDRASEQQMTAAIREHFGSAVLANLQGTPWGPPTLISADFQKIKLQFRALGLITKDTSQKSVKDTSTYWTLTPYGDALMTTMNAQRKAVPAGGILSS